jgi:rhodanese-related sulfurtransferase
MNITFFALSIIAFLACNSLSKQETKPATEAEIYKCLPCGYDCDTIIHRGPGTCSHCNMELVKASTINFKTLQPNEICDYIKKHPNTVLLDVRTRGEFEGQANPNFGTLKNAINLPIQDFNTQLNTISGLKDKEIIVYCSHSHRSPRASYQLTQNGFTNIINLAGGMSQVKDSLCKR